MLHPYLERRKFAAFVVPAFSRIVFVLACESESKRVLELYKHYVFVGCKIVYAAVLGSGAEVRG